MQNICTIGTKVEIRRLYRYFTARLSYLVNSVHLSVLANNQVSFFSFRSDIYDLTNLSQ